MLVHHPSRFLTLEIVGIEASNNSRSCDQHDMCGSVLDDDVVIWLRKVQILNRNGHEETAIAAYLVFNGIDQCCVGFLLRHFVAHAKSFDGVLAQVSKVYSSTSDSPLEKEMLPQSWLLAMASAPVNRIVVQKEVLENDEEEQVIEVGKNAAGNHDTNNSRDNDEDHSTFKAPSSLPAALVIAPVQYTGCAQTSKNAALTPTPPPPATRKNNGYETPESERRNI